MSGRGPRARRGDVRAAILALLAEEPRNGYGIMQEIDERSGGVWRPSPGAVYPALALLEDEGLVRAQEADGRRVFALTDEGHALVKERGDELKAPWDAVTGGAKSGYVELRDLVKQLAAAVMQAATVGSPAQTEELKKILTDARRAVYRVLAEDETEE
jgi:DNA-binding PadR family transcriptional regulator